MVSTSTRILVLGAGLAPLAKDAFLGAAIEVFAQADGGLAAAAAGADLVLVEGDGQPVGALEAAFGQLARTSPQPAVILAGASIPVALARALLKLERSDALDTPLRAPDLARAAAPLLRPKAAAPCMCWGVMGAVGGAGATTIAIESAAALAAGAKTGRGCIIDLNLADGAVAAYLGVPANMRLDEASHSPERIDQALLDAFCTHAFAGVDLLAAPRSPHAFDTVKPQSVMRVLDVAAQKYDWIIIDIPRHRRAWTLDVLSGCDEILVVSELTVPALLAARDLCQELEAELPDRPAPGVVLNRLSARVMGPAPTVGEAQRALNRKAVGAVTSDWESAARAVNLSGPILHRQPRSKIVRDIRTLVTQLTGRQAGMSEDGLRIAG
jgi:pilus assembly protein CpaE